MSVDLHVHSNFSDGEDELYYLLQEANENNIDHLAFSDHANVADTDKNYPTEMPFLRSDLYSEDSDLIDSDTELFGQERVIDILRTRNHTLEVEAQDNDNCMLCEDYKDKSGGGLELGVMREILDSTIIYRGLEIDYNPPIEHGSNSEEYLEIAKSYNKEIEDFLELAENEDLGLDTLLGSVHDINDDYTPLYVKKDDLFEDMTTKQKREVVDNYFTKLEFLVDSNIFDVVSHPSLIERNNSLMQALPSEQFDSREGQLEEYYLSFIEHLEDSTTIPEFNGKGVERQEPSVFWELVKELDVPHTRGSDSHRHGEMSSRQLRFEEVEDSKKSELPEM